MALMLFDASIGWTTLQRDIGEGELAQVLGLGPDRVQMVPTGSQADAFLIGYAQRNAVPIVTNDRFRDRLNPDLDLRLVKGMIIGGQAVIDPVIG
ncbi:hypothetical protein Rumeso_04427 [Rubellimicrobium mesophilum DSM 19309]|uniref:PIN domain-containing protein n=1 Tax=Rubellimicrobium mesophilum DSM 19309 TaxID=442562 RepID=A0A017HIA0_9RHOB|nr:hypothetical protein [Rubellimicrobium mesophilum]EYD74056.1 hypothetical protein Rumeso_04427 [Rubellimicrobium mesophilum DSM 19309]